MDPEEELAEVRRRQERFAELGRKLHEHREQAIARAALAGVPYRRISRLLGDAVSPSTVGQIVRRHRDYV